MNVPQQGFEFQNKNRNSTNARNLPANLKPSTAVKQIEEFSRESRPIPNTNRNLFSPPRIFRYHHAVVDQKTAQCLNSRDCAADRKIPLKKHFACSMCHVPQKHYLPEKKLFQNMFRLPLPDSKFPNQVSQNYPRLLFSNWSPKITCHRFPFVKFISITVTRNMKFPNDQKFRKGVGGRGLATNKAQNTTRKGPQNCVLLLIRGA